jgi:hypothetical protein
VVSAVALHTSDGIGTAPSRCWGAGSNPRPHRDRSIISGSGARAVDSDVESTRPSAPFWADLTQPRFSNTHSIRRAGLHWRIISPCRPIKSPAYFCTRRPPFRLLRPDASYPSTCCLLGGREIAEAPDDPGTREHAHVSPRDRSALRAAEEARGNRVSNHLGPSLKIVRSW